MAKFKFRPSFAPRAFAGRSSSERFERLDLPLYRNEGPFSESWALARWDGRLGVGDLERLVKKPATCDASVCCAGCVAVVPRRLWRDTGLYRSGEGPLARCPDCGEEALVRLSRADCGNEARLPLLRFLYQRFVSPGDRRR